MRYASVRNCGCSYTTDYDMLQQAGYDYAGVSGHGEKVALVFIFSRMSHLPHLSS